MYNLVFIREGVFKLRSSVICSIAGLALLSTAATVRAQQATSAPSIIIGTTLVKLGMAKGALIASLSSQFVVKPMAEDCTDSPLCRAYTAYQADNSPVASLDFDRDGRVVKASVERLPGMKNHGEGEVGAALVAALTNFAAEGLRCSIQSSSSQSYDPKNAERIIPRFISREAIIECGNKRLRITSFKFEGHADSLQLTEEIGCPIEVIGSCEK